MEHRHSPSYPKVKQWVSEYGNSGAEDRRAVSDFVTIEPAETVASLRNELASIAKGMYDDRLMSQVVGAKRKDRHGSYQEWARLMLMWMANAKV
ncbi:MAG: hypothetical protein J5J00_17170 [Deltaproteobacteria bacterium]|nr:hypothetical protein [Deltaproteobacteria bacterium]